MLFDFKLSPDHFRDFLQPPNTTSWGPLQGHHSSPGCTGRHLQIMCKQPGAFLFSNQSTHSLYDLIHISYSFLFQGEVKQGSGWKWGWSRQQEVGLGCDIWTSTEKVFWVTAAPVKEGPAQMDLAHDGWDSSIVEVLLLPLKQGQVLMIQTARMFLQGNLPCEILAREPRLR